MKLCIALFTVAFLSACGFEATQEVAPATAKEEAARPSAGVAEAAPVQAATAEATPAPADAGLSVGIAHVGGAYGAQKGMSFLEAGARQIAALGTKTIKVYLTPNYAKDYPELPATNAQSLAQLAGSRGFNDLFAMPFETYVLTTYTFNSGSGDAWKFTDDDEFYAREYEEVRGLAEHMLNTWANTGKTFIFQNWESDWVLLENYDLKSDVAPERVARMRRWLATRQQAVSDARTALGEKGVRILHAAEVNRVLDAVASRLKHRAISAVLRGLKLDAVSYSAWESLDVGGVANTAAAVAAVTANMTQAVSTIRENVPGAVVYLGEIGFAEEGFRPDVKQVVSGLLDTARNLDIRWAVYWQIFDNECQGPTNCRGFWIRRPDGSLSGAGEVIAQTAARGNGQG